MNNLLALAALVALLLLSGCSATRYEVRVSYSPMADCDISAKVFGN
jgi:hypothetical protein